MRACDAAALRGEGHANRGKIGRLYRQAQHSPHVAGECIRALCRRDPEAVDPEGEDGQALVGALLLGDGLKWLEIIGKAITGAKG